jgi:hypothetical protein
MTERETQLKLSNCGGNFYLRVGFELCRDMSIKLLTEILYVQTNIKKRHVLFKLLKKIRASYMQ